MTIKLRRCPIEVGFYKSVIGKKWTLTIIRDLTLGYRQFSDFMRNNPGLSSKVLAERLKELMENGIIQKKLSGKSASDFEYTLTSKGIDLNKVLYELSLFGSKYYPEEVFGGDEYTFEEIVDFFGRGFRLPEENLEFEKMPTVVKQELVSAIE